MKHSRSAAEVEIRDAVVSRFRKLWPNARIVHEMNVDEGMNRADVVAVTPDRLIICEIKSELDVADRLAQQLHAFGPVSHALILAAHERWFESPGDRVRTRKRKGDRLVAGPDGRAVVEHGVFEQSFTSRMPSPMQDLLGEFPHWGVSEWKYPEPEGTYGRWDIHTYEWRTPWSAKLLHLLWRDELQVACGQLKIGMGMRATRSDYIAEILRLAKGREIEAVVCRQLRSRPFAEADAPIEVAHS